MKTKKRIFSVLLCLSFLTAVIISDCTATKKESKFIFWDKSEYIQDYNNINKIMAQDFCRAKGYTLDYVIMNSNGLKSKLMAAIEANSAPDLIVTDDFTATQFVGMRQALDVTDVVSKLNLTKAAKTITNMKGKYYAVMQAILAPAMYIRKDKFDAAGLSYPTTWQEVVDDALKLTDKEHDFYGAGFPLGASGGGDAEGWLRSLIFSYGGMLVNKNNKIVVNSSKTLQALKLAATMFMNGSEPPSAITWDDSGNNQAFLAGQIAITFNSGSLMNAINTINTDLKDKVLALSYPKGPTGSFVPSGGNVFMILAKSKNPSAAKGFIQAFFKKSYYSSLVQKLAPMWQPALSGFDNDPFWKTSNNIGWLNTSKNICSLNYPLQMDDKASQAMSSQVIVKAMQNIVVYHMEPQKALDALENNLKTIYAQ